MKQKIAFFASLLAATCFLITPTARCQWVQTSGPRVPIVSFNGFVSTGADLFAANYAAGVFHSTDNGATWTPINTGLPDQSGYGIVTDGTHIFGCGVGGVSPGGVSVSVDNGNTWQSASEGLPSSGVYRLCMTGSTLFAFAEDFCIYRSTDFGGNWSKVKARVANVIYSSFAANGANVFLGAYASASQGVYRSTDNGISWVAVNSGLKNMSVNDLSIAGVNLFALTDSGYFVSTDNGTNWAVATTLPAANNFLVANGTNLFAATGSGISRSTDNGTTWMCSNSLHRARTCLR
jgi:hypothetical protein